MRAFNEYKKLREKIFPYLKNNKIQYVSEKKRTVLQIKLKLMIKVTKKKLVLKKESFEMDEFLSILIHRFLTFEHFKTILISYDTLYLKIQNLKIC